MFEGIKGKIYSTKNFAKYPKSFMNGLTGIYYFELMKIENSVV